MSNTSKNSSAGIQVWYTHCPVWSAGNIDSELGWIEEEMKKLGAKFSYFRSTAENNWYPHYRQGLKGLFRFGGACPAIHVNADLQPTKLIGLTWLYEGGAMVVRARDPIYSMQDLQGRKIGISKSLNALKNDWWRCTEERGIEMFLAVNHMTRDDVEIVDFPQFDDWYDKPEMLTPVSRPAEIWLKRDLKNDKSFQPLLEHLENGEIDAMYVAAGMYQTEELSGKFKVVDRLDRYPDWTLQVANSPFTITVDAEFAEDYPELVVAYMRGIIKVGRWTNDNKRAAATLLHKTTLHPTVEMTAKAMEGIDFVPSLSPFHLAALEIQKDWMFSHGYIKNDFDIREWAASEFMEEALKTL